MQDIFLGMKVLARDMYWGSYVGIVVDRFTTHVGNRVKVQIESMVEAPLQHSILFEDVIYPRAPYIPGSIHNFFESEIEIINCKGQG